MRAQEAPAAAAAPADAAEEEEEKPAPKPKVINFLHNHMLHCVGWKFVVHWLGGSSQLVHVLM